MLLVDLIATRSFDKEQGHNMKFIASSSESPTQFAKPIFLITFTLPKEKRVVSD